MVTILFAGETPTKSYNDGIHSHNAGRALTVKVAAGRSRLDPQPHVVLNAAYAPTMYKYLLAGRQLKDLEYAEHEQEWEDQNASRQRIGLYALQTH